MKYLAICDVSLMCQTSTGNHWTNILPTSPQE
jgi:hypothetical protein